MWWPVCLPGLQSSNLTTLNPVAQVAQTPYDYSHVNMQDHLEITAVF